VKNEEIEEGDSCGEHYRVDVQVERCDGLSFAMGFNFHGTMEENLAGMGSLLLATAKTPEQRAFAESMMGHLRAAFKMKPVKSVKSKSKPGPKVVPIRPAPSVGAKPERVSERVPNRVLERVREVLERDPERGPERGPFAKTVPITVCEYIEGPGLSPGWKCHECAEKHPEGMATYNGIVRDSCKLCGHKCCMSSKELKAARKKS
jgi:hypothetical protein